MKIEKFVDNYGDDVFALALIVTKDLSSAEGVYARLAKYCAGYPEQPELFRLCADAYSACADANVNEDAVILSAVELNAAQDALMQEVLDNLQVVRAIIHLTYENDLTPQQTAKVVGASEKYVSSVLAGLPDKLKASLDKSYKEICLKIRAGNDLKSYVIEAETSPEKRQFEQRETAVPLHKWTRNQKIAVVVTAIVVAALISFIIPIVDGYLAMRREEGNTSYTEVDENLSFTYSYNESE